MGDTTLATDLAEPLNFAYSDLISWQGRREANSFKLGCNQTQQRFGRAFDFREGLYVPLQWLPSEDLNNITFYKI